MGIRFCYCGNENRLSNNRGVVANSNLFQNLHFKFLFLKEDYLPVTDEKDNIIFNAYNDTSIDSTIHKIWNMANCKNGQLFFKSFNTVTIISCNEIGYNLYQVFNKVGVKVYFVGDIWKAIIKDAIIVSIPIGISIYCEGNLGLSLKDAGFYRNAFPYNEFEFIEKAYKSMVDSHTLYDDCWLSKYEANDAIYNRICGGEPFVAARLGNTEAAIVQEFLHGSYSKKWLDWLYSTSGFFSKGSINIDDIESYAILTINAIKQCDFHCCRFDREAGLINVFHNSKAVNINWYDLYTDFEAGKVWFDGLKNKKVLVISSAVDTIVHQYNNCRNIIHDNVELPLFDIIGYTPPQTQLSNHDTYASWFEYFDNLVNSVSKIDFDIAIVAAGAYGYPLSMKIKEMGKQVIELCSGIYPLFGIKVKAQTIIRKVSQMYNENWIFPIESPPKDYMSIENGSYWGGMT